MLKIISKVLDGSIFITRNRPKLHVRFKTCALNKTCTSNSSFSIHIYESTLVGDLKKYIQNIIPARASRFIIDQINGIYVSESDSLYSLVDKSKMNEISVLVKDSQIQMRHVIC